MKGHKSLWKPAGNMKNINFWQCNEILFQRDLASPSVKGSYACKLAQIWEFVEAPGFSVWRRKEISVHSNWNTNS